MITVECSFDERTCSFYENGLCNANHELAYHTSRSFMLQRLPESDNFPPLAQDCIQAFLCNFPHVGCLRHPSKS